MQDEENCEKETVEPEDVVEFLEADGAKLNKPMNLTKMAMMEMVIKGWVRVEEDPAEFCKVAYHCLRRLPIPSVDPQLVQTVIMNWTVNQGKENWVLALACLRYAIAKIIYDLGDNASAWAEPTSDICPVRIGQRMGILHKNVMVEPDFDVWKHADETSMCRIMDDVRLACSIRGLYPELPAFTAEW